MSARGAGAVGFGPFPLSPNVADDRPGKSRRMTGVAGWSVRAAFALLLLYGLSAFPGFAARWGVSGASVGVLAGWAALAATGCAVLRERTGVPAAAALGAALIAARTAFALLAVGRTSTGDPNAYLNLAKGLLAGRGLVLYDPYLGGAWRALFPPAYPVLLAGWGAAFGFSTPAVLALGTLTDLGAAALIARLGRALGDARAGRRAAWLYLVWPSVLFSAPLAQKESLCAVLALALALVWLRPPRGWRGALALGLPAGLLALTQPGEAPLAALFGLVQMSRLGARAVLGTGLRGAAVAALAMLPWWVRNAFVFHAFVPLTTASEVSLWIGNNPTATGNWEPPPAGLRGLPELTYGKRIAPLATGWIAAHPAEFVRLTLTKFVRASGVAEFGINRLVAMGPPFPRALAAALWPLAQATHVALLGAAALRAARLRGGGGGGMPLALVLMIAACGLQLVLFGVWFEFGERHREFVTPFLLLAACWPVEKARPNV